MKKEERKVLPILALVFGGIGLALSWIPFINNLAFLFAIVGLILGIVAFIVNLKKKKILTIIGTIISLAGIVIVLVSQSAYSDAVDKVSKDVSTTTTSTKTKKSSDSDTASKSTNSLNYDPNLVSDEKIKSIKTYGDYLDAYKLVVDDYIGYYNYKLEQLNLTDSDYKEEYKKTKAELDTEYKKAKEEYASMKNMPLSGSEEILAQALIQARDTYRQAVDTIFGS
ncbi:DUF4190 domain-containing protein [Streptococcus caviae]|uniref:hypothetical protein n=1 Tax=Streptococcus sp. 'caviae' TaxID=1915004 RepID=UPI00094BA4B1|nr:hypothetical protein [Streptococcus sp. 'caviae']OLN84708.1 hypothetical protein BMI76_01115 [Streptococcus sp. 'caviae']